MRFTRRFALGALMGGVLAGCGGGGGNGGGAGGGGTGSGAPAGPASGSGAGAGAASPPATGQAFSAFGPTLLASGAGGRAPAVARLSGGGNVALWFEDGEIRGQLTDAAGTPSGNVFTAVAASFEGTYRLGMGPMAVAATADGGFVVAYARETMRAQTQFSAGAALQVRRFTAGGSVVWDRQASESTFHDVTNPVIEPWGEDFIVGWSSDVVLPAPPHGFLQRIGADGARASAQVTVTATYVGDQDHVRVAPLQDGTVVVVWRRLPGLHFFRRFAADLTPLTEPVPLPVGPTLAPYPIDVEALAGGNVAIAWGIAAQNTRPMVAVAIYTPDGVAVSQAQTSVLEFVPTDLRVLSFGATGFGVAWQVERAGPRDTTAAIELWRFDGAGEPAGAPEMIESRLVSTFRPETVFVSAGSGFDIKGGPDGHFVATFLRLNEAPDVYLLGR